ncbi:MAG TPA: YdeI/OmpD-associated family protein [Drouetiella sp.]
MKKSLQTNPKVDEYIKKLKTWREETALLREIALDCGLVEDFKWYKPCYTANDANVVVLQGFKNECAILFFKGALMKDAEKLLIKPGENTQAGRKISFRNVQEIAKLKKVLKDYIKEAVSIEESGIKPEPVKAPQIEIPEELASQFKKSKKLETAFYALTPGRQRHYLMHFTGAKQSQTRTSRIEKCTPLILQGKGLND